MDEKVVNDIEVASPSVVKMAARDFAAALAATPRFKVFQQAAERFRQDLAAQQAMAAYQEKQTAWRALRMHNMLSPEQKIELESLKRAFVGRPVVQEYFRAQTEFAALCQTLGDALSESLGLNYAAACGVRCCE